MLEQDRLVLCIAKNEVPEKLVLQEEPRYPPTERLEPIKYFNHGLLLLYL